MEASFNKIQDEVLTILQFKFNDIVTVGPLKIDYNEDSELCVVVEVTTFDNKYMVTIVDGIFNNKIELPF